MSQLQGGLSMSKINFKKRKETKRFTDSLFKFLMNTQSIQDVTEKDQYFEGGYIEYYLVNANKFSREKLEDNLKYCNMVEHLSKLVFSDALKEWDTISVEQALFFANADVIFKYEFHDKKFKKWQRQVYKILTFQD